MSLNQNSLLSKRGMIRQDQEHQRFTSVGIVLNFSNLRMRGRNDLIALEMVMDNSLPSWSLTLTEFGYSSSGSVTTFNDRKRFFWSKFLIGRNIDAVVMRDSTEIDVPLTNGRWTQPFEHRRISTEVALLNVGLKHEPTRSDAACTKGAVPVIASDDPVTSDNSSFHDIYKAADEITRWQLRQY